MPITVKRPNPSTLDPGTGPDPRTGDNDTPLPYTPQGAVATADELANTIAHVIAGAGVPLEVAYEATTMVDEWLGSLEPAEGEPESADDSA